MPAEVFDRLGNFSKGMDSGVDPLLLPNTQLAFASNATVRGDFLRPRPAYANINLSYASDSVRNDLQAGLFQGARYYKPDSGAESIGVQVGGLQFLFTPDAAGGCAVTEISIPGDPSSATQPQAWIRQAENFLIFNNGLDLPVFYDGSTSRRSNGAGQQLAEVGPAFTAPTIGTTVDITVAAPGYSGPLNQTILIGSAHYVVTAVGGNTATSQVTLQCLFETGASHSVGDSLLIMPGVVGGVTLGARFNVDSSGHKAYPVTSTSTGALPPGFPTGPYPQTPLLFSYTIGGVAAFTGRSYGNYDTYTGKTLPGNDSFFFFVYPFGQSVMPSTGLICTIASLAGVVSNVGTLAAGFAAQPVGNEISVGITKPYVGSVGDIVWIGSGQYRVVSFGTAQPVSSLTITVENLDDTPHSVATNTPLLTLPELPAGRALTYGLGQVWESMTDGISFLASDIVDSDSGSPQYNYRDSVLRVTQNSFLNGGGLFRVPGTVGDIRAMEFVAQLDVSLGQGPLQIFTPTCVFGCAIPPGTQWASVSAPLLTQALLGAGGCSHEAVALTNGDIIFRSADGQIRSLLMARLDYNRWSNTPISREMNRVLALEDQSLLDYAIIKVFDNRALIGTGLTASTRGVYCSSLVALNFDPVCSLRGEEDSVYDGQWTGLNVLKLVSGFFGGVERCFAVCLSADLTQIELHEILPSDGPTSAHFDNGNQPIQVSFETSVLDFDDRKAEKRNYHRLKYGEIFVDEIVGDVQFQAFYKPDQWTDWVPWHSWTRKYIPPGDPGFSPRIGLPEPDGAVFDRVNDRPLREGFWFQFKLVMTGQARFLGARFSADIIPMPKFAVPMFDKTS
jgi:hypothetical protein